MKIDFEVKFGLTKKEAWMFIRLVGSNLSMLGLMTVKNSLLFLPFIFFFLVDIDFEEDEKN